MIPERKGEQCVPKDANSMKDGYLVCFFIAGSPAHGLTQGFGLVLSCCDTGTQNQGYSSTAFLFFNLTQSH